MPSKSRTARLAAPLLLALALPALATPPSPPPAGDWKKELADWRAKRVERLKSPDGWLAVIGLDWLEEGPNTVGSAAGSRVQLPAGKGPAKLGTIDRTGMNLVFRAAPGATVTANGKPVTGPVEMALDSSGQPTTIAAGSISFFAIERAGRVGIRLKDREAAALREFRGIESYPPTEAMRIEARWEPYDPPKKVRTPTVIGTNEEQLAPGAAVFEVNGKTVRLEPVLEEEGADELFFVFGDQTNGGTTYGGGRFLYTPLPKNGKIVLDFNRAYNPPCVFTAYATCPLPRKENRLPVPIPAGEKGYVGGAHH